jgi:hypothetical protein
LQAWAKDHPLRGFLPAYHDARAEGLNNASTSTCSGHWLRRGW